MEEAEQDALLGVSWREHFIPAPGPSAAPEGGRFLFVRLTPAPGAYLYAPFAPGLHGAEQFAAEEYARPATLELSGAAPFYYPPGRLRQDAFTAKTVPVYDAPTLIFVRLPESLPPESLLEDGESPRLVLNALVCTDKSCAPLRREYALDTAGRELSGEYIPKSAALAAWRAVSSAPEAARSLERYLAGVEPRFPAGGPEAAALGTALALGLPAGFILNFMPCVLPALALKLGVLAGLGGTAGLGGSGAALYQARRRLRLYGIFFSLGILTWFSLLFGLLGIAGILWGQFFQSREFVIGLSLLLFLLALVMFGRLRLPAPRLAPDQRASLPWQAFFSGLLATLLATPCSGPLLGGVLAWAVGRPLPYLGLTLGSVALGMAAPFILLALRPSVARFLPKPGAWNKILEGCLGFLLLGTVIYLLSLLEAESLPRLLLSCLLLAFAAWLPPLRAPGALKIFGGAAKLLVLLAALVLPFIPPNAQRRWENFAPAAFTTSLGRENMLLDFTAEWCVNCKVMELTTLAEARLEAWTKKYALRLIKVDLTRANPEGEALLRALGGASIPLLAIIPARRPDSPVTLRDLATPGQVEEALRLAFSRDQP